MSVLSKLRNGVFSRAAGAVALGTAAIAVPAQAEEQNTQNADASSNISVVSYSQNALQTNRPFYGETLEGYSYDVRSQRPLFAKVLAEDYSKNGDYAIVYRGTESSLANKIDEVNRFVMQNSDASAVIILAPPMPNGDNNIEIFYNGASDNPQGISFIDEEARLVEPRLLAEMMSEARTRSLRRVNFEDASPLSQ